MTLPETQERIRNMLSAWFGERHTKLSVCLEDKLWEHSYNGTLSTSRRYSCSVMLQIDGLPGKYHSWQVDDENLMQLPHRLKDKVPDIIRALQLQEATAAALANCETVPV